MNAQDAPAFGGTITQDEGTATVAPSGGPNPFAALADQKAKSAVVTPVSFPPTPEQEEILKGFRAGHDMVIAAGAGTGKTSTITLLAEDLYKRDRTARGVYIAFNKSIANEVGSKLIYGNVSAMTVHSLAYRWAKNDPQVSKLMDRLNRDFREIMTLRERVKAFGVRQRESFGADAGPINPKNNPPLYEIVGTTACREAEEAIKRFCQSDDDKIGPQHVKVTENIHKKVRPHYRARIAEIAQRMWDEDITQPGGRLRFTHDVYLKLFAMSSPNIPELLGFAGRTSVLFFDEAQDSRPCITQIVMSQQGRMQIVLCGDSAQAIYRFTGCRDAIRGFKKFDGVKTFTLSKTFRFGAQVAMVANQVLHMIDGADVRIVPDLSIPSVVIPVDRMEEMSGAYTDDVDAVICRSNRQLIEMTMRLLGEGVSVFCATDTDMIVELARDYEALQYGDKPKNPMMRQFRSAAEIDRLVNRKPDPEDNDDVDAEVDEIVLSILSAIVKNGAHSVISAMRNCSKDERRADVVLSTIHKAKGRQWDNVMVAWEAASLAYRSGNPAAFNDELMLLYVAVTRARRTLYMTEDMFEGLHISLPVMRKPDAIAQLMSSPITVSDDQFAETTQYVQSILGAGADSPYLVNIVEQVLADDIKPHELVGAMVFVSEKYLPNANVPRYSRGDALTAFLASVGISPTREVMDLSDSGMPDELLAAMLEPDDSVLATNARGNTVRKMLTASE